MYIIINEEICGTNRNQLYDKLKEYNIFARKYFYPLVTDFQCYKGIYDYSNLNHAKYVSDRVLTLPIYGRLRREDAINIVKIIDIIIKIK